MADDMAEAEKTGRTGPVGQAGQAGQAGNAQQAAHAGDVGSAGGAEAAESAAAVRARKDRERDELYALDISGVEWQCAPGTEQHEERVEIAHLPEGAVAMRSSLDPETVLRYTEAEWRAFVLGARDGEFDLEPAPGDKG